jgi:hypothetical protein
MDFVAVWFVWGRFEEVFLALPFCLVDWAWLNARSNITSEAHHEA